MPILHWLTRDRDVKAADAVPYRLLERDAALSAGAPGSGNMLIQGDNLEALKSLLPNYRGQVKCIYIDPPYNTRSAVSVHYDDTLEHSQWLAMIYPRLELLQKLLAEDGSIWVSIDDHEGHYLKIVMDEVFGELPPSEWSIDYESLDQGRDDECLPRSTSPKRSSASCVRLRSCWARAARLPRHAGASQSASRPITVGARNMVV